MNTTTRATLLVAIVLSLWCRDGRAQQGLGVVFFAEVSGSAEPFWRSHTDSLVVHVRERLRSTPGVTLLEPWAEQPAFRPSFDRQWGGFAPPTADSLAKASAAAVVVHLRMELRDSLLQYDCAAIEPGSGVTVAAERGDLVLPAGCGETLELLDEATDRISARLLSRITPYGYPFPDEQVGVLLVASDSADCCLALQGFLDERLANAHIQNVRRKVVWHTSRPGIPEALRLADLLHASLVLSCLPNASNGEPVIGVRACTSPGPSAFAMRVPLTPEAGPCVEAVVDAEQGLRRAIDLIMARVFYATGRHQEAIALATTSLQGPGELLAHGPWFRLVRAQARHTLARTAGTSLPPESIDQALEDYGACLGACGAADDSLRAPEMLFNMADLRRVRGEDDRATWDFAHAALGFARKHAWREQILSYAAIEEYHRSRGAWSQARNVCANIVALAQRNGDALSLGAVYDNLGMLFEVEGVTDSALEAYRRGLEIYHLVGNAYGIAELEGKLSMTFRRLGRADSAHVHVARQIALGEELRSEPLLAKGHFTLALLLRADECLDSALVHFSASLEQFRLMDDQPGMARALNNLGAVHHERGDSTQAAHFYQGSLEVAHKADEKLLATRAMLNLGDLCRDGQNYPEASAWYEQALASARGAGDPHSEALALFALGLVRVKTGKISEGYALLEKAVQLGESVEPKEFAPQRQFLRRLRQVIGQEP